MGEARTHDRRDSECPEQLPRDRYSALADALGDTPHTAIDLHHILRGTCRVYIAGALPDFEAAIIQIDDISQEVDGYGREPAQLAALLTQVQGWDCILVRGDLADPLATLLEAQMGCKIRHYSDIAYHAPKGPQIRHEHPDVRLLTASDLSLFEAAPGELQGGGFGSPGNLLDEGFAAGAILDGRLFALAHTSAITPRHGDIGVHCLPQYRGRGYATAAAYLVGEKLHASGRTPIWSTGEDNWASRRVAEKLGFEEVGRRVYLIPLREQG
jgi:hypothetical protein